MHIWHSIAESTGKFQSILRESCLKICISAKLSNRLAKILAKKCSGKLYEVTERLKEPILEQEKTELICEEILTASKTPRKEGRGYEYPAIGHVVGLEGKIQGDRKWLLQLAGY